MKCGFWGSRVETVRRNSLVALAVRLGTCCHRGRGTVVRQWWGSFVKCTFWGSRVETVRRNSLVPRCPPGACQRRLLPLPVSVMLIFRCFLVQAVNFISYGVCKFVFLGSPLGHPKGVPCAELSPQVTEGLPATAANRFHKELRFFFSLLKRKKEAKKEKSSRFTCTTRSSITRRLHINKNPPAGQTGGCCRRNITLFTLEIGA